MSRRKKNAALVSCVDDSRIITNDFLRRTLYESYRPMGYRIYGKLQEKALHTMLDRCLNRLLPGADDGNGNMLNNKLLAIGFQSMVDLEQQRISHRDTIHRLASRWSADQADLLQMMEAEQKNLECLLEEHRRTCALLAAYEKGESGQ